MNNIISEFKGEYYFLSNFSSSFIKYKGLFFLNAEAAYQSCKVTKDKKRFEGLLPREAKTLGRKVKLRKDWEIKKDKFMYIVVKNKFKQNKNLLIKLLNTGDKELIEGNNWGDTYWGVCNGIGENKLGKILMRVRKELKQYN